jgi:hypothetical protein
LITIRTGKGFKKAYDGVMVNVVKNETYSLESTADVSGELERLASQRLEDIAAELKLLIKKYNLAIQGEMYD